MEKILTVPQMVLCEQTSDKSGVSLGQLMDNAGRKLAEHIARVCKKIGAEKAVLLIGKGNNGGDGSVAANIILREYGILAEIILCCGEPATGLSKAAFDKLDKNIPVHCFCEEDEKITELICKADLLVDCIFGTGFHGGIRENVLPIFRAAAKNGGYVIACDVPSGVNADNGSAAEFSISADLTVTFHRKKLGLLLSPGKYNCGELIAEDIGIADECENKLDFSLYTPDKAFLERILPERTPWGHKGIFGKVISVCGSQSYIGAGGISALSAMRTGVGLFDLCTAKPVVDSLSSRILECTYSVMQTDRDGFMISANAEKILEMCSKAQCLLIGCGLGHTPETEKLVAELVEKSPCTVVIDADGINSLVPNIDVLYRRKSQVILTPHPAELARLTGKSTAEVTADRFETARELSQKYGAAVLAKGAESFAVYNDEAWLISKGNTALAKGGSGDMLAGIVSSFTAQGCGPAEACVLASYIMGGTAEMLSRKMSPRGILASDIIDALPEFLKELDSD